MQYLIATYKSACHYHTSRHIMANTLQLQSLPKDYIKALKELVMSKYRFRVILTQMHLLYKKRRIYVHFVS